MNITMLGIDLAKNVFQLHGVDKYGKAVLKKAITRNKLSAFIAALPTGLSNCDGSIEDAHYVFSSETITFEDDRNDYGETRYITLGELEGRVVIMVHTKRHHITRIISMRKANAREQKIYQQRLKEIRQIKR